MNKSFHFVATKATLKPSQINPFDDLESSSDNLTPSGELSKFSSNSEYFAFKSLTLDFNSDTSFALIKSKPPSINFNCSHDICGTKSNLELSTFAIKFLFISPV